MKHGFRVTSDDQGLRLDVFLHHRLPEMSRATIRTVIDIGGVHVDGRRARKNGLAVQAGQEVELHRDRQPLEPFRLSSEMILFQDEYLLAIDKPAGVDTQPTPARYKGTLYEALQVWLGRDSRFGRKLEIGMVQRLDRDTSGVIVFSIHPRAHGSLSDQFRQRQVRKFYLALVAGRIDSAGGSFTSRLGRDRRSNRMRSVSAGGREALCHYRTLQYGEDSSLVLIELVTGRTHQIRAQFAEAGHPLVGDTRYGGPTGCDGRQVTGHCLHSWRIRLAHPRSGETLEFVAPVPTGMEGAQFPRIDHTLGSADISF